MSKTEEIILFILSIKSIKSIKSIMLPSSQVPKAPQNSLPCLIALVPTGKDGD